MVEVMSLEDIKAEVAVMPEEQQDKLAAFLVHLRHRREMNSREAITTRIDDKDPENWVSLDELREKWKD